MNGLVLTRVLDLYQPTLTLTLPFHVIGDAVEHICTGELCRRRGQINRSHDVARHRIDLDDQVGPPRAGLNLALDPFELINTPTGAAIGGDINPACFGRAIGIKKAEIARPITHA
jgi:hypothetical protein